MCEERSPPAAEAPTWRARASSEGFRPPTASGASLRPQRGAAAARAGRSRSPRSSLVPFPRGAVGFQVFDHLVEDVPRNDHAADLGIAPPPPPPPLGLDFRGDRVDLQTAFAHGLDRFHAFAPA